MKALFIMHESNFIYGANRSITGLLRKINYDFDILICKSFTKKVAEGEIRSLLGDHLKNIYICWLPRYRCFDFDKRGMISELSHYVNNIMACINSHKRKKIIARGNYNYIHLNSLVLFPIINDEDIYIIHIREIFSQQYHNKKKLFGKLYKASGLIYIDEAVKKALGQIIDNRRTIVLNNPFDMLRIREEDYEDNIKKYNCKKDNVIFAMLGQLADTKGSKFVIRSFMGQHNENSRLLIVGNDNHAYGRECRDLARKDKRIIFCGELKNVDGIYRISDYIIRGESQFCIGRTIYEGLFSGAGVIIPGSVKDLERMPDKEIFKEKICFYKPQDTMSLLHVLETSCTKQVDREYRSNTDDYIRQYNYFINGIVEKGGTEL